MTEEKKFNAKFVLYIGFAFFTAELAWGLYNARVSLFLKDHLIFLGLVGIWMALDNIIGVILQPIMGSLSDNTRTKYGRRMPYLIVGIPLAAVFFSLIPFLRAELTSLLIIIFLFGIAMGSYRAQAVAIMPDFVRSEHRSKGNAIINAMGGVGAVIGYGLSLLSGIITVEGAFIVAAILMILGLVVLLSKVNENDSFSYKSLLELEKKEGKKIKSEKKTPGLIASFSDILKEKDLSTLIMLFAIFSWFIAYQGLAALLSIYGETVLNQSESIAGFLPFFFALPIIIFAYPFAKVAEKLGRRKAIKIGLTIISTCVLIGYFLGYAGSNALIGIILILIIAGMGWSFVNVNSIVIIWEMAPSEEKIGTYTGVYYFFSYLAGILGPYILGSLTDLTSSPTMPHTLLLIGAIFFMISLVLMFFVKRGEATLTEEEKKAKQKAIQNL